MFFKQIYIKYHHVTFEPDTVLVVELRKKERGRETETEREIRQGGREKGREGGRKGRRERGTEIKAGN